MANQINVMNVMGRKRKRSAAGVLPSLDKRRAAKIAKLGVEALITMDRMEDGLFIHQLHRRLTETASIKTE